MSAVRIAAGALCGTVVGLIPAGGIVGIACAAGGDTSGAALGAAILFALAGVAIGAPVGGVIAKRTDRKAKTTPQTYKR